MELVVFFYLNFVPIKWSCLNFRATSIILNACHAYITNILFSYYQINAIRLCQFLIGGKEDTLINIDLLAL